VERSDDAVARQPGLARDRLPEEAAAADHEEVHQGMVMRRNVTPGAA
jgi:hypothetical protein